MTLTGRDRVPTVGPTQCWDGRGRRPLSEQDSRTDGVVSAMRPTVLNPGTDRQPAGGASTDPAAIDRCAESVAGYFAGIHADLRGLQQCVLDVCAARGPVTADAVSRAALEPTRSMMARHPVLGGGFVAAPGFLADHHLYLAWWQGDNRQLLAQSAGPTGEPVDYTRLEWFKVPARTGGPHVAGPYVDYVCSDEYLLTATSAVVVDGRFAGVVGADTLLEVFESLMLPAVKGAGATVINDNDRVVVSYDPRVPTGRLVDRAAYSRAVACSGTPFTVVA